jgi:hypothetical protein
MRRLSVLAVSLFVLGSVSAQKFSGSLAPLKGQKEVNVVIDYSGMLVNGKTEKEYITNETKKKNATEKAQWLAEWNEKLHSDAYFTLTNDLGKNLNKGLFSVGDYPDADYTIKIKVVEITTGIAMMSTSAVKATVKIIKTGGASPIATVEFKRASSKLSVNIPYFVTRIVVSFGKLGDDLAKTINKNMKK